MLNFSPDKLFVVGIIALIVLGPNRLPQAARTLGRLMSELRRMSSSFQEEVRDAMGDSVDPIFSAASAASNAANKVSQLRPDIRKTVRDTLALPPAPGTAADAGTAGVSGAQPAPPSLGPTSDSAVPDDPTLN